MIIGLTGSIGSGKSTVSARLKSLGALILDADIIAREVVDIGTDGLKQIERVFGSEAISADGRLDRKAVAKIVFEDSTKRKQLNDIIHPAVLNELKKRSSEQYNVDHNRLIIWDVPLLIEAGWANLTDSVWLVTAPMQTRLERIIKRDGCTLSQAESRIRAQLSEDEKRRYSDEIIDNSCGLAELYAQTDKLYHKYTGVNA